MTSTFKAIYDKLCVAYGLAKLGADTTSRVKLGFLAIWVPVKKRFGLGDKTDAHVFLKKFGQRRPFTIHENMDLLTLQEIFVEDEYAAVRDLPTAPKIIFDIGSNIGTSILYFDMLLQGKARIFGFEPNPVAFERLRQNVSSCPNITVYPYAVSGSDALIPFYVHPSHLSSSVKQRIVGSKPIQVEAKSLDSLFALTGVDRVNLLKFDVEGAEFDVFGHTVSLAHIDALIGELHLDLFPQTKEQFLSLFHGFTHREERLSDARFIVEFTASRCDSHDLE